MKPLSVVKVLALSLCVATSVAAQSAGTHDGPDSTRVFLLDGLNVTAIRGLRTVYETPAPVVVFDASRIEREGVANVSDLFKQVAGLDAEGVGPGQRRPVIRGMRGQRVLLLEDGLRLNNARRRVDSGEPTGLVWPSALERVEVVRGPASVLYGSDAVGGVVNLVSRSGRSRSTGLSGVLEASRRSTGRASSFSGDLSGGIGRLDFRISGGVRDAGSYEAPAGNFGTFTVDDPVEVHDSGVRDASLRVEGRYSLSDRHGLFARHEVYRSEDSGFGWIDPIHLGPDAAKTRLWWPEQEFGRSVLGYKGRDLETALADAFDITAYRQGNRRSFLTEVSAPIPGTPGVVDVRSDNFTDVGSRGVRVEARKLARRGFVLTYGVDAYEDRSEGTDSSVTTVSGLGPTTVSERKGPQIPDASLLNLGGFVQGQLEVGSTELVLGMRYQDVRAKTFATPGSDAIPVSYRDRTLVGAANVLQRVGKRMRLVASVGRGFRTPNLVERFFTGLTGNNRGYWEANPDLGPEVSLNVELGARVRSDRVQAEVFAFRNTLKHGIVLEATGEKIGRATVYRNVNVDELRYRGLEAAVDVAVGGGFAVGVNGTLLSASDRRDPTRVIADSYPSRWGAVLRYDSGPFWVQYAVRHNGTRGTLPGSTPVGDVIPSFTVHRLGAGVPMGRHTLVLTVDNLTDALYSEALNTGFFRPEPGRSVSLSWAVAF